MANELEILGGYTWDDIVGETTRGMARMNGEEVLGAAFNAPQNPAFNAQIARQAAANRPVMRQQPLVKKRQQTLGLGRTYIGVNATVAINVTPQIFYRAEKLIASDNCTLLGGAGYGTQVTGVSVGAKSQLPTGPGSAGIPTYTFAQNSLGNGVEWDTCQPAITISIQVQDLGVTPGGSTWSGSLFGSTVQS